MISCKDASKLMSRARDAKLSLRERLALRLHMAFCAMCRRYETQLGILSEMAQRFGDRAQPPAAHCAGLDQAARGEILEKVRRQLADQENDGAGPTTDRPSPTGS